MKKYSILSICLLLNLSCAKDFLDKQPLSQLNAEVFYKTEDDAFKAILACYSTLQVPFFYGRSVPYITELASDDANHKNTSNPLDIFNWTENSINESEKFSDLWKQCYEGVYRCNLVLDNVDLIRKDGKPAIKFSIEADRSAMLAEARFLRGLYYWHLAAYWGDVPIILDVKDDVEKLNIPTSPEKEVYAQIIDDLQKAEADLPTAWSTENGGRATKYACKALLGKVYIFNQQWDLAIPKLKEVVTDGGYTLLPKFRDIFSRTNELNSESIFEIQFGEIGPWQPWNPFISDIGVGGEGDFRDLIMAPQNVGGQTGFGEIIAEKDLVEEYEYFDSRLRETVHYPFDENDNFILDTLYGYNTDKSQKLETYSKAWLKIVKAGGNPERLYFHIKKAVQAYQGIGTTGNSTNNWRMIRLADVMLLLAEAYNETGDVESAIPLLNKVRDRARGVEFKNNPNQINPKKYVESLKDSVEVLPHFVSGSGYFGNAAIGGFDLDFSGGTQDAMRRAIIHERRMELAFEYHRFLDMTRWERINQNHPGAANVVFANKPPFYTRDYVYGKHGRCPIPRFQIDLSKGTLKQNPNY